MVAFVGSPSIFVSVSNGKLNLVVLVSFDIVCCRFDVSINFLHIRVLSFANIALSVTSTSSLVGMMTRLLTDYLDLLR